MYNNNVKCEAKRTRFLPNRDQIVFIARINPEIEKYFYKDGTVYVAHINPQRGGVRYYETRADLNIKIEELDSMIKDFACDRENKVFSRY